MTLHVHRFGTGEQHHYLGIHGWGGGWRTFEPLAPFVPEDATLWSVDLPGYGSSAPLREWRWEQLTDRIVETLEAIDAPRFQLVGNCSGAAFGLAAALRRPDQFERLVLIDLFAYFPWYFELLVAPAVGRMFYATAFQNPVGRWITDRGLADHRAEDSDLTASFEALDHDVVHQYLRMLHQLPAVATFAGLQQPIVLVYGEHTFGAVRESVRRCSRIWPHARAVELAGAGHLPIQEATSTLAAQIFAGTMQ